MTKKDVVKVYDKIRDSMLRLHEHTKIVRKECPQLDYNTARSVAMVELERKKKLLRKKMIKMTKKKSVEELDKYFIENPETLRYL